MYRIKIILLFLLCSGKSFGQNNSIRFDKQNGLWLILQSNGINYFNPSTEKFEHFFYNPSNPHSISWSSINCYLCDSKNNIWFGTVHGLNRYNPMQKGFDKYYGNIDSIQALPDDNINDIKEDSKGNLWIATNKGVVVMNPSNNKITRLASLVRHSFINLNNTAVRKIYIEPNDQVWMCTQREGVLCFNSFTGTLVNYNSKTTSDNLPVSDIAVEESDRLKSAFLSNMSHEIRTPIKDTGIGIPKEVGNSIFERFLKVESTKTKLYEGVGLGLSISYSLVKAMGGNNLVRVGLRTGYNLFFYYTM
jgi:Histidine kinase-, DNA gyrase B-, and HSP90-like ATPase/Two component regulator propeller